MEGIDGLLKDDYSQRNHAIQKCAVAALTWGYKMFAIQDGGMCVGSPNAHKSYGKYGKSQDCKNDGKGGAGANQVYNLTGIMEGKVTRTIVNWQLTCWFSVTSYIYFSEICFLKIDE